LTQLHAGIGRDIRELQSRWTRWTAPRRGADGRQGIVDRLGANPEDIVNIAFRTFRAVRLLQEALAGAPPAAAGRDGDAPA
jgi:hypothetical protein